MNEFGSAPPEQSKQQKSLLEESTRPKSPIEDILETREKTGDKFLSGGTHETRFIEFKDDGAGIFKPDGETWKRERGVLSKRERAAYIIDCFLDFDLVPPTVIRVIDGKEGSLQQFIPDAKDAYETSEREMELLSDQLIKLWIFDLIIANKDRNRKNLLIKDNRVYAIDNGYSFASDYSYSFRTFFDVPISDEIKEKISRFLSWPDGKKILKSLLLELLPENWVERCFQRIETVGKYVKKGFIPTGGLEPYS